MAVRVVWGLAEVVRWQKGSSRVYQRQIDGSKDSLRSTRGSWTAVRII